MTSSFQKSAFENTAQAVADLSRQICKLVNTDKYGLNFEYDMRTALPSSHCLNKLESLRKRTSLTHHDKIKFTHLLEAKIPEQLKKLKSFYMSGNGGLCPKDWENSTLVFSILPSGWEFRIRLESVRDKDDEPFEVELKTNLHGDTLYRLQSHAELPLGGDIKTFVLDFKPGYANPPYTLKAPSGQAAVARICALLPHSYLSLTGVCEKLDTDCVAQSAKDILNGSSAQNTA